MTSVKRVESKIHKIEGFLVKILHKVGRDVRDDNLIGKSFPSHGLGNASVPPRSPGPKEMAIW